MVSVLVTLAIGVLTIVIGAGACLLVWALIIKLLRMLGLLDV